MDPEIQREIVSWESDPYYSVYSKLFQYRNTLLEPRTFESITDMIRLGRELLILAEIRGYWFQRVSSITAREWEVLPGKRLFQDPTAEDQRAADFVSAVIEALDFDELMSDQALAIWHGYAVTEIQWARDSRQYYPGLLTARKQERFRFDNQGCPRLITRSNMDPGEEVERTRLWVTTYGGVPGDPYGRGLAESCFYPAFFLKGGIKSWLFWLEKNGGTTVVEYPEDAGPAVRAKALQLARAYRRDTGIAIPDNMAISLLETSRTTGDYENLYNVADRMLQKVILGQEGTSGSTGMVRGEISKTVRDEIIKNDSDLLHKSFAKDVITPLVRWNFGEDVAVPQVYRKDDDSIDLDKAADTELKLQALGYEREPEEFVKIFGAGLRKVAKPADLSQPGILRGLPPGMPAFAEGSALMLPEVLAANTADRIRRIPSGLDLVKQLAEESGSLEEFQTRLYDLQDRMPLDKMAEIIAQQGILARLAGSTEVKAEIID